MFSTARSSRSRRICQPPALVWCPSWVLSHRVEFLLLPWPLSRPLSQAPDFSRFLRPSLSSFSSCLLIIAPFLCYILHFHHRQCLSLCSLRPCSRHSPLLGLIRVGHGIPRVRFPLDFPMVLNESEGPASGDGLSLRCVVICPRLF